MNHEYYKILLEKKVNGTISSSESETLEKHLSVCEECRNDLKEVENMNKLLENHNYVSPEDILWENYKESIYAKIERGVGWIFFSVGSILLITIGLFYFIKDFLLDNKINIIIRLGTGLLIIGVVVLLVSVIRERIFFNKHERYKEVKK